MEIIRPAIALLFTLCLIQPGRTDDDRLTNGHLAVFASCLECHDEDSGEGGFVIPSGDLDWSNANTLDLLETAHRFVAKRIMPPPDAEPLDDDQREELLRWLDTKLLQHSSVGGTRLRRLSRREYANTIRDVFGLKDFELPHSFPPDNLQHGFDNQAAALVTSGSHLEAFAETATLVADELFSLPRPVVPSRKHIVDAKDLVISYSSAKLTDGAMRLASSGSNVVRNGTWPSRFVAPEHGRYQVEIVAFAFGTPAKEAPVLQINAMELPRNEKQRLAELTVDSPQEETFQIEIDLDRDQTIVFRYPNGPFDYDKSASLAESLREIFAKEPRLAAAWETIGEVPRGGSGWDRLKLAMTDPKLDVPDDDAHPEALESLIKRLSKKSVNTGESLVYKFFGEGPGIAIKKVRIIGPIEQFNDRDDIRIQRQRIDLMGAFAGRSDPDALRGFLSDLLGQAFRREATEDEIDTYMNLVRSELDSTGELHKALHLAVRTMLISPAFLYRNLDFSEMSDAGLANRLSYFLTSGPPDRQLRERSRHGDLQDSQTLRSEAKRILNDRFIGDFTSQWLGLDVVQKLMPDKSLVRKFTNDYRRGMVGEVEMMFTHVLDNNLPMGELIDADYVFTSELLAKQIYDLDWPEPDPNAPKRKPNAINRELRRIPVPDGSVRGGLLSMPAVMMATANGVDTQPVLRGVWFLTNVLGSPPPDPPDAVPALTPDTGGATTPREQLTAHTNDTSCAVCHHEIDPVGFVFENFDPIGRWRDNYPNRSDDRAKPRKTVNLPVEADGVLPDGTELADIRDLKQWLAAHPEKFARCLSEKLMTYATGRQLSYREQAMVAEIVDRHAKANYPFQDVLLDLIDSSVFRTR